MREKTNLTLHKKVKSEGELLAKSEGRSLSGLVERLLEKYIDANRGSLSIISEDPSGYTAQIKSAQNNIQGQIKKLKKKNARKD